MNTKNLIIVGKLGSSYGIRGWLRVFSFTQQSETLFNYSPWYIKKAGEWQVIEVESHKPHNQDIIVKIKGIDDRTIANELTNYDIYVDESNLPKLDDGDYYWKDLVGCKVINDKGYDFGHVTELMETGSNDVLVVKANEKDAFGMTERLIPFVEDQFILTVDLDEKLIKVNWDPAF